MTGNTLTMNPVTGTNPYATSAFGTPQQGFWGNAGGFGGQTPFGFGTQAYQPQLTNPIYQTGGFTPQLTPQMIQQPGVIGQTTPQWQAGLTNIPTVGLQGILNTVQQTCPPEVVNAILQTTPPQVLPYVLNALACQQVCQQVLAQNPQALQAINPQAITQPFQTPTNANVGQFGVGGTIGGFGINRTPFVGGVQPQVVPQLLAQGACVGCPPGQAAWAPNVGFQGGFGQNVPQQPWLGNTYGTW